MLIYSKKLNLISDALNVAHSVVNDKHITLKADLKEDLLMTVYNVDKHAVIETGNIPKYVSEIYLSYLRDSISKYSIILSDLEKREKLINPPNFLKIRKGEKKKCLDNLNKFNALLEKF